MSSSGKSACISALAAVFITMVPLMPSSVRAQDNREIRYMNLNDETVGGRRITFTDKTIMSLHKNHDFTIAGPLHVGFYESGGKKPTRGRWEIRYGNTLWIDMEDKSSRSYVIFKIGPKMYLRTVPNGGFGELITNIAPMR